MHGKRYVSADFGREIGIETESFQVNAQHLKRGKEREGI